MNNYNNFFSLIKALYNNKLLDNFILIGSWAEIFYQNNLVDFNCAIKTYDIDFLINHDKRRTGNIREVLKNEGYIYKEDYLTFKSKFIKDELEVEFLDKINRNNDHISKNNNLNINVEHLEYLDILQDNYCAYWIDDIPINVPTPSAYVIQKIIINNDRNKKQEKDISAIMNVLNSIEKTPLEYKNFLDIFKNQSKKRQKKILSFWNKHNLDIRYSLLRDSKK